MNTIDIEKLNQLISRTDISGNDKVRWLTDFIDGREFHQQERSYNNMQEYATFCIECDRKKMPLLLAQDWYEHYKNK